MLSMNFDKKSKAMAHILTTFYGLSMVYLFYRQTLWSGGAVYESDLPAHIQMSVVDGWYYSLTAFAYRAFYLLPEPFANLGIAVFLALCGVASVYLTAFLLRDMQSDQAKSLGGGEDAGWRRKKSLTAGNLFGGLLLNLVMPCYIKGLSDGRYIGMESASIWHNSTYIVMKMTGLFCILYYGKLERKYRQGISGREWLFFSLLLSLCTAVKPSFLVVFAPAMAVFLLVDFLKKTHFKRVFLFGSTVFLPLAVILLQNVVLFGAETGNGWEIRPGHWLSAHSGHPFLAAGLSVFFPLLLLPVFWRGLLEDRWFSGAWLMAAVGFLEVFLFAETGDRADAGNFMWGYSFAVLMIFAVALVKWEMLLRKILQGEKNREHRFQTGVLIISGLVLCWHLYCGIYFYINLLQGVSYMMWN